MDMDKTNSTYYLKKKKNSPIVKKCLVVQIIFHPVFQRGTVVFLPCSYIRENVGKSGPLANSSLHKNGSSRLCCLDMFESSDETRKTSFNLV